MPASTSPAVLIVEDQATTRRFLADNLCADGYEPLEAPTLARARQVIGERRPAIALLDLSLPDGDGLEFLAEVRDRATSPCADLPVIVLSGRATELERVRGLRRGADDYVVKPYSYEELVARIEGLLRRSARRLAPRRIGVGTLEIDCDSRETWVEGRAVRLSGKEFSLLRMLADAPTRTFTREELLREVWGFRSPGLTRTLDTHAHRLRRKLSSGGSTFVINVWGVGYRLTDSETPAP